MFAKHAIEASAASALGRLYLYFECLRVGVTGFAALAAHRRL